MGGIHVVWLSLGGYMYIDMYMGGYVVWLALGGYMCMYIWEVLCRFASFRWLHVHKYGGYYIILATFVWLNVHVYVRCMYYIIGQLYVATCTCIRHGWYYDFRSQVKLYLNRPHL